MRYQDIINFKPMSIYQLVRTSTITRRQAFEMAEGRNCGCGRSPTGQCFGWHKLNEADYAAKKEAYEAKKAAKAQVAAE